MEAEEQPASLGVLVAAFLHGYYTLATPGSPGTSEASQIGIFKCEDSDSAA